MYAPGEWGIFKRRSKKLAYVMAFVTARLLNVVRKEVLSRTESQQSGVVTSRLNIRCSTCSAGVSMEMGMDWECVRYNIVGRIAECNDDGVLKDVLWQVDAHRILNEVEGGSTAAGVPSILSANG